MGSFLGKYRHLVFLLLTLILFLSLSFYHLGDKLLEGDELADVIYTAQRPINLNFIRTGEPHPPLWFFTLHFWNIVAGTGPISSRILPMIFGLLTIFMAHKLAKHLFDLRTANLSALLLSISPILLYHARTSTKYALFAFLSLLNFYLFLRFIESRSLKNTLFFLFSSILLLQVHFYSMFIFLAEFLFVAFQKPFRKNLKLLKALIVIFIITALFLLPQIFLTLKHGMYDYPYAEPWHDMLIPEGMSKLQNMYYYLVDDGIFWNGLWMLGLFYMFYFFSRDNSLIPFIFFISFPTILFIMSFFMNIRHYHLIFLLPFYAIFFANYVFWISGMQLFSSKKAYRRTFIAISFLVIIALSVAGFPRLYAKAYPTEELAYIMENWNDGDLIVVDGFKGFVVSYYSDLPYKNLSLMQFSDPKTHIDSIIAPRKWVIYTFELEFNDENYFEHSTISWLSNNCDLVFKKRLYLCE